MAGTNVFERNSAEDHVYWRGVLDLPELTDESIAWDFLSHDDSGDFEGCLGEWWSDFIADFSL